MRTIQNRKSVLVVACLYVIYLLLIGGIVNAAIPSSTFTISTGIYPGAPSYTIWLEAGKYYAKSMYGAIDYSESNFQTILTSVNNALRLTGGSIYLKNLRFDNIITLYPTVTLIEDLYGKITHYPTHVRFEKLLFENNDQFSFQVHVYPKAIYSPNTRKTYITWLDTDETPWLAKVKAYYHDTETLGSTYTLGSVAGQDSHMACAIGILSTGKLIVFYGAHSTTNLFYRISTNPEDERYWQTEQTFAKINMGWTYPQPCSFSDKLVLFARDSVSATQTRWLKNTTTNGTSWTGWVEVVNFGGGYAPYFVFHKEANYILASGSVSTYSNSESTNLYFAYSDDQGATWKEEDDSAVVLPIDSDQLVVSIVDKFGYTFSVLDADSRPVLTGTKFDQEKFVVAQYTAPLGESGSWVNAYAQDEDGTDLVLRAEMGGVTGDFMIYPILVNKQVSFMGAETSTEETTLFRRIEGSRFRFEKAYLDSSSDCAAYCMSEGIQNSQLAVNPLTFLIEESATVDNTPGGPWTTNPSIYARSFQRRV